MRVELTIALIMRPNGTFAAHVVDVVDGVEHYSRDLLKGTKMKDVMKAWRHVLLAHLDKIEHLNLIPQRHQHQDCRAGQHDRMTRLGRYPGTTRRKVAASADSAVDPFLPVAGL